MKKNFRTIITIVCIVSVLLALYYAFLYFFSGDIRGRSKFADSYYAGSELQGVLSISDDSNNYYKNGKIHLTIYDNDGKKVKNGKATIKFEDSHIIPVSIPLDENLENGNYSLNITFWHGLIKEEGDINFRISGNKSQKTIISLDKGIYKPGDSVKYRVLMISENGSKPISSEDVTVEIYYGNDNKVYSETTKTSDYGIVSGGFGLASEVNSGDYKLVVKKGTLTETKIFKVNPYVEPKYSLEVTPDKDYYIFGDKARITVDAQYFFGEPVKEATVRMQASDFGFDKTIYTDENGKATFELDINDINRKSENIEVSCVDTSNYSIEKTVNISFGKGSNTLELFSDFGENIAVYGLNNKLYFILKDERDNPIKSYGNIVIGDTLKRDFITDETGIGSISLSSSDLERLTNNVTVKMTFRDGEEDKLITAPLTIKKIEGLLLTTDKIKYKSGEKIEVSLNYDSYSTDKFLYVVKSDQILQIIPIKSDKIDVMIDSNISGLITFFVSDMNYYRSSYNYASKYDQYMNSQKIDSNRKTIFVASDKGLTIGINTDKEEYKPGEKININFDVNSKESNEVDAALLVSILDEAILSLADNDLSIDNIMLDLSDIELAEGMTLADLYAMILNEADETELNALLLKQNVDKGELLAGGYYSFFYSSYDGSQFGKMILFGLIGLLSICILLYRPIKNNAKANKVFKTVVESGIALITIFIVLQLILYEFLEEFTYYSISRSHSEIVAILINCTLTIVSYLLLLYNFRYIIIKGLIELVVIPMIAAIIAFIFVSNDIVGIGVLVGCILLIGYSICVVISRNGNEKMHKIISKVNVVPIFLIKSLLKAAIVYIIIGLGDGSGIAVLIALAVYVLISLANKDKKAMNIKDGKWIMNFTKGEAVGFASGLALVAIVIAFLLILGFIYNSSQSTINDSMTSFSPQFDNRGLDTTDFSQSGGFSYSAPISTQAGDSSGASSSINKFKDTFNFGKKSMSADVSAEEYEYEEIPYEDAEDVSNDENVKTEETTTKIRNIFVESLAFIPELVAENGKASYEMNLSDNITTWNIQVVGNSKDGNLGFGTKQFKVFKEFFTDVSLPTNAVEGDSVSLPITVYNYTEAPLSVHINVPNNDWSNIGTYETDINVEAKNTKMIYVPIEILKQGEHILRVEATANGKSDIVERSIKVNYKGLEQSIVSSNGSAEGKTDLDVLFDKTNVISGSEKIKVKIYPTVMSLVLNNVDSMIKLPTGCFEQTSSSLYPDILILKYLKSNNMDTPELRAKLDDYISKGYQKLLTYEVKGESGGYSLYGNSPAETVITAFGLMEFNELKEVYEVEDVVINEMKDFVYSKQNFDGSFDYNSTYIGSAASTTDDAMVAYIAWALSEVDPEDSRLKSTERYLEKAYKNNKDGYTLALIANVFQNTQNKNYEEVIGKLKDLVKDQDADKAYVGTSTRDYYGSYSSTQDMQATALMSIALSRSKGEKQLNNKLVNYVFSQIDEHGTWRTTQATILGLKALNEAKSSSEKVSKAITATLNGETQTIDLSEKNALDIYELTFTNINEQNKLQLDLGSEEMMYEVVKEYYINYPENNINDGIDVTYSLSQNNLMVNDKLTQSISVKTSSIVNNMIVKVDIPQGFSVDESSLLNLKYKGIIEKYEYNYGKINLYIRNGYNSDRALNIVYKANYPVNITGGAVEAYDYYNVSVRGYSNPINIVVNQ